MKSATKTKYQFQLPVSPSRLSAISALITDEAHTSVVEEVPISLINGNPYQPRKVYVEEDLADLTESIKEHGILQPLIGRQEQGGMYTLIAGHRRLKASTILGKKTVPLVVRQNTTDEDLKVLALIENLQRSDLHVVDKLRAMVDISSCYKTQVQAAQILGMRQDALAHWLRAGKLSDEVLQICAQIPDFTLRGLLRLVNVPVNYQLREARRCLVSARKVKTEKKNLQEKNKLGVTIKNVRLFYIDDPDKKLSFTVEVRSKARKKIITNEDYKQVFLKIIAELDVVK